MRCVGRAEIFKGVVQQTGKERVVTARVNSIPSLLSDIKICPTKSLFLWDVKVSSCISFSERYLFLRFFLGLLQGEQRDVFWLNWFVLSFFVAFCKNFVNSAFQIELIHLSMCPSLTLDDPPENVIYFSDVSFKCSWGERWRDNGSKKSVRTSGQDKPSWNTVAAKTCGAFRLLCSKYSTCVCFIVAA